MWLVVTLFYNKILLFQSTSAMYTSYHIIKHIYYIYIYNKLNQMNSYQALYIYNVNACTCMYCICELYIDIWEEFVNWLGVDLRKKK